MTRTHSKCEMVDMYSVEQVEYTTNEVLEDYYNGINPPEYQKPEISFDGFKDMVENSSENSSSKLLKVKDAFFKFRCEVINIYIQVTSFIMAYTNQYFGNVVTLFKNTYTVSLQSITSLMKKMDTSILSDTVFNICILLLALMCIEIIFYALLSCLIVLLDTNHEQSYELPKLLDSIPETKIKYDYFWSIIVI